MDFDKQEIHVRTQVQRLRDEKGLTETTPKQDEQRTIPIGDRVTAALRAHRARQNEERLAGGNRYVDQNLVFPTRKGAHMDASNVVNRSFKPLLKSVGVPQIRFHDQRHTFATLLLSKGVDAETVKVLLGHADVATTLKYYGHSLPEMQRRPLPTAHRGSPVRADIGHFFRRVAPRLHHLAFVDQMAE